MDIVVKKFKRQYPFYHLIYVEMYYGNVIQDFNKYKVL